MYWPFFHTWSSWPFFCVVLWLYYVVFVGHISYAMDTRLSTSMIGRKAFAFKKMKYVAFCQVCWFYNVASVKASSSPSICTSHSAQSCHLWRTCFNSADHLSIPHLMLAYSRWSEPIFFPLEGSPFNPFCIIKIFVSPAVQFTVYLPTIFFFYCAWDNKFRVSALSTLDRELWLTPVTLVLVVLWCRIIFPPLSPGSRNSSRFRKVS